MYSYNQFINNEVTSNAYYAVERVRLERIGLKLLHNSFVTDPYRVYHKETNICSNHDYSRALPGQWQSSYSAYESPYEQGWKYNFNFNGYFLNQSSCYYPSYHRSLPTQLEAQAIRAKLSVESVIDLYLGNSFHYLPLKNIYCKYGQEHMRLIFEKYSNHFEQRGDLLFFKPQIQLCGLHLRQGGCSNGTSCQDIHLCLDFLLDSCYSNCNLGHKWETEHNMRVFKKFHMNTISDRRSYYLKNLLRETLLCFRGSNELQLCPEYDANACNNKTCLKLHICFKFISKKFENNSITISCDSDCASQNSENEPLKEKHNIKSYHNKKILAVHKMNLNETSINLIMKIKSLMQIVEQINLTTSQPTETPESIVQRPKLEVESTKTFWSESLYGNVDIAQICYYSVEGKCRDEVQGCPRLHSSTHFHWQVQDASGNGIWCNFPRNQVIQLESAFCDVNTTEVLMCQVDPKEVSSRTIGHFLLERGVSWTANFSEMMVKCCETDVGFKIRRLCTEYINKKDIQECNNYWYFYDKCGQWTEYSEGDLTDQMNIKSYMSSANIEKHFKKDPNSIINFTVHSSLYYICFSSFRQVNKKTGTKREIRRRPKPHWTITDVFPAYWRRMKRNELFIREQLDSSSSEYQKIQSRIKSEELMHTIEKIERIQNPFLWKAFINKIEEMTAIYKNEECVNIQYLYHGTKREFLDTICAENVDWRLHGCSVGAIYGKGAYFTPFPKRAMKYCDKPPNQYKYIFMVRVAVGQMCVGKRIMSRPPINPKTKRPFDSTCDQLVNPQRIVKYDKQEVYPEYILQLKLV